MKYKVDVYYNDTKDEHGRPVFALMEVDEYGSRFVRDRGDGYAEVPHKFSYKHTLTVEIGDGGNAVDACERVYRLMQAVDGSEPVCALGVRSMCVGDLLVVHVPRSTAWNAGTFAVVFACRAMGFENVSSEAKYPELAWVKRERTYKARG